MGRMDAADHQPTPPGQPQPPMAQRLEVEWITWEQWRRIARRLSLDTGEGLRGRPEGTGQRKLQMLMGIVGGLETAEIAKAVGITPKTAEGYIAELYDRMEVDRRCRAVSKAWRASLNE